LDSGCLWPRGSIHQGLYDARPLSYRDATGVPLRTGILQPLTEAVHERFRRNSPKRPIAVKNLCELQSRKQTLTAIS